MKSGAAQAAPAAPLPTALGPTAGTDLPLWNGRQVIDPNLHVQAGGNNFFRGGPYISEKFVPGGNEFERGPN